MRVFVGAGRHILLGELLGRNGDGSYTVRVIASDVYEPGDVVVFREPSGPFAFYATVYDCLRPYDEGRAWYEFEFWVKHNLVSRWRERARSAGLKKGRLASFTRRLKSMLLRRVRVAKEAGRLSWELAKELERRAEALAREFIEKNGGELRLEPRGWDWFVSYLRRMPGVRVISDEPYGSSGRVVFDVYGVEGVFAITKVDGEWHGYLEIGVDGKERLVKRTAKDVYDEVIMRLYVERSKLVKRWEEDGPKNWRGFVRALEDYGIKVLDGARSGIRSASLRALLPGGKEVCIWYYKDRGEIRGGLEVDGSIRAWDFPSLRALYGGLLEIVTHLR